jgi:hypothetical protein
VDTARPDSLSRMVAVARSALDVLGCRLAAAMAVPLRTDWRAVGQEPALPIACNRPGCFFVGFHSEVVCPNDGHLLRASAGGWRSPPRLVVRDPARPAPVDRRGPLRRFWEGITLDPRARHRRNTVDRVLPWALPLLTVAVLLAWFALPLGAVALGVASVAGLTLLAAETVWRYARLSLVARPLAVLTGLVVVLCGQHLRVLATVGVIFVASASLVHLARVQALNTSGRPVDGLPPPETDREAVLLQWMCLLSACASVVVIVLVLTGRVGWRVLGLPLVPAAAVAVRLCFLETAGAFVGAAPAATQDGTLGRARHALAQSDRDLAAVGAAWWARARLLCARVARDARFTLRTSVVLLAGLLTGQTAAYAAGRRLGLYVSRGDVLAGLVPAVVLGAAGLLCLVGAVAAVARGLRSAPGALVDMTVLLLRKAWAAELLVLSAALLTSLKTESIGQRGGLGLVSAGLVLLLITRAVRYVRSDRHLPPRVAQAG